MIVAEILGLALAINHAALLVPIRRRFAAAVERQDGDSLDAVLDETASMWPRNAGIRAFIDANRAVALMYRERWDEAAVRARGALESQPPAQEPLLLNNLAWALAHTGALDTAAATGERALAGAQTDRLRAFAHGTLGAIYALRGEGERALDHLNRADSIDRGGDAIQATRQYYRAWVFQSTGRRYDAVVALEAACAAAPASPFGRRSQVLLTELQPPR